MIDTASKRRLEPRDVRAALGGIDVVDEAVNIFRVTVVVLHGDLNVGVVSLTEKINDFWVQSGFGLRDLLHKRHDAAAKSVFILFFLAGTLVLERDRKALIKERQLAQAVGQNIVSIFDWNVKNFLVGFERNLRAGGFGFSDDRQLGRGFPALKAHVINLAVTLNFNLEPLREGIDTADADAMQTAGNFIRILVKFSARVQ